MDSCGTPPKTPSKASRRINVGGRRPRLAGSLRTCAWLLLPLTLAGCVSIRHGTLPRTDRLEQLKVGVSTSADILQALGEPRGRGAARLATDPKLRTTWFYEFTAAGGSRVDLKMLLVFLTEDQRYEGHLWFSANTLLDTKE